MSTQSATKEKNKVRIKEPKQFNVIMHNDDFTTMEFVISVLIDIFRKDEVSAEAIMLKVHNNGKAVVGKYPYDIAITRANLAMTKAESEGFPFRITVEEA